MRSINSLCFGVGLMLMAVAAAPVHAQANYPDHAIKMVVPQAPGGASDIYARVFSRKLSEILGQSVVVDNRGGAGGNLGADAVAKAAPDGYTVLFAPAAGITVNPHIYASMPFQPTRDLTPIISFVDLPMLLVVNPSLPFRDVKGLIQYAKAHPGKLTYASSGAGQMVHLAMELLKSTAHVDIVHVPYKQAGQALTEVMSGQVDMMFLSIPATLAHVKSGKLRALGVNSSSRSAAVPEIPTVAEAGVPGFEARLWLGLWAPAGADRAVIAKLHAAGKQALNSPDIQQRMVADGTQMLGASPDEMGNQIRRESEKWSKLLREIGYRPE